MRVASCQFKVNAFREIGKPSVSVTITELGTTLSVSSKAGWLQSSIVFERNDLNSPWLKANVGARLMTKTSNLIGNLGI